MKKGDLALDTIVSWIILLVVAGVVIGLIFGFSDQIKVILNLESEEKSYDTEYMTSASFSESQVGTYIEICWSKTGERFTKDFICYTLEGNISAVNPVTIAGAYDGYVVESNFDNTKGILIIRFEDIGNKIILTN
ncbi:MAG: hypothetical protein KAT28_01465 [Candidatus Aenigmarchaeota archaeon]|nr:hypothetical protein [Candidatus Aenigmarchaeota archaeon]